MTTPNKTLSIRTETIQALDTAAAEYQLGSVTATPFQKTFLLAEAMGSMRELLTPEIMKPIMALMNTDLGFRTDRDPNQKGKDGRPNTPYDVAVVRDIVIEGTLRGYFVVNNEFNIIAGRFYAAKNGIRRKVTKWQGLTDFKDTYSVPRNVGDKGAVVACSATWKINGIDDSITCEIPVKVNDFMGTDAILGKSERKLLKRVLDRISGEITPDGEIDDDPTAPAAPTPKEKAVVGKATTVKNETVPIAVQEKSPVTQEVKSTDVRKEAETTPPVAQESSPITEEEKADILRKEALDTPAAEYGDLESKMAAVMSIDTITTDELGGALTALGVKIPRDFKGPSSLTDDVITKIMQAKTWQTIRSWILNSRDKDKAP